MPCLLQLSAGPAGPADRSSSAPLSIRLQLLCVEFWHEESEEALTGLISSNFPFKLDVNGDLHDHPEYSGLADFGTALVAPLGN